MRRVISSIYNRQPHKDTVNLRRINRETHRVKLNKASFIDVPRLVTAKFFNRARMMS